MEFSSKVSTKKRQGCENAKKGNSKEESKGTSKLADQRLHGEDEHLLVLQDVGGDVVEEELVWFVELQWHEGANQ